MLTPKFPLDYLSRLGFLLLLSLVWTVFIPGLIAYHNNVFYVEDMVKRLKPPASLDYETFQNAQKSRQATQKVLTSQIESYSSQTSSPASNSIDQNHARLVDLKLLLESESSLATSTSNRVAPIVLAPFFLNPQLWLWPAIYFCLGCLVTIFLPAEASYGTSRPVYRRTYFIVGFSIYVLYEWPLWARNFIFGNHGRTLYAYTNFDIDPASFFMQELVVLGFCLLLAVLWVKWLSLPLLLDQQQAQSSDFGDAMNSKVVENLSDLLFRWQYTSVVLALGFGFFSNFFWSIVFQFHDQRYLISAISAHLLWAISWIAISTPLVARWQQWESTRLKAVIQVLNNSAVSLDDREKIAKDLREIQPGGFGIVLGSAIIAVTSFVLPILKEVFH